MKDNRKLAALMIIVLFFGMCITPSLTGVKETVPNFSSDAVVVPPVEITIDGILGDNGWYISCVTITMEATGPNVSYIMLKLDDGDWQEYTGPFVIREDGIHLLCWYSVDNEGNQSHPECIEIKIDQTPPIINGLTAKKIEINTWLFTADVFDETSGVNRVEFYVDGEFVGVVTEAPYILEYSGTGYGLQIVVYDNAGNEAISYPPPPPPPPPPGIVFGIIRDPEFTEETVTFFAIIVVYYIFPCILRQLTFPNDYSGYIGEHFIFAIF